MSISLHSGRPGLRVHIPSDDPRRANTLRALGDEELALGLDGGVDIVAFVGTVGDIVVGDVVDLVLVHEFGGDDPGAIRDDLIHPLAVADALGAFGAAEDGQTFAQMGLGVARDADHEMDIGEGLFGLFELTHVANRRSVF